MNFSIRTPRAADYRKACDLGTICYPERYYEGEASFMSKMTLNPEGCLVAEKDDKIIGYAISFPYMDGLTFPIDQEYKTPENPDCTYIHDVCVLKEFRKLGVASKLVRTLTSKPGKYRLTSVENSESFWEKMGFNIIKDVYYCGFKARYMGMQNQ